MLAAGSRHGGDHAAGVLGFDLGVTFSFEVIVNRDPLGKRVSKISAHPWPEGKDDSLSPHAAAGDLLPQGDLGPSQPGDRIRDSVRSVLGVGGDRFGVDGLAVAIHRADDAGAEVDHHLRAGQRFGADGEGEGLEIAR
jgi:hypothetical protein